jgi:hypothetical protein
MPASDQRLQIATGLQILLQFRAPHVLGYLLRLYHGSNPSVEY